MTNLSSPPPNRRRRLSADELIAIFVALTGLGGIFFWGINQQNPSGVFSWLNNPSNPNSSNPAINNPPVNLGNGSINLGNSDEQVNLIPIEPKKTDSITTPKDNITTLPSPPSISTPKLPLIPVPVPDVSSSVINPQVTISPKAIPSVTPTGTATAKVPEFQDLPQDFWGRPYILELHKRGILNDFGDGKFEPNRPVSRAEFAAMISKAFNKPTNLPAPNFKDIGDDPERKAAIAKSVQMGFMTGYSANKFAPDQKIPRHQLQIALIKGLNITPSGDVDQILSKFPDAKDMPKYAREKMSAAIESTILVQDKDVKKLKPVDIATRADAASLIYQALIKDGQIQP